MPETVFTFFDDKTDPISSQNWVLAALRALHGRVPLAVFCAESQGLHEAVAAELEGVEIHLIDREAFYEQRSDELAKMGERLLRRRRLVWHVSHYENGTTPTLLLHRLLSADPRSGLVIKSGTVRNEFTPENYFPDGGKSVRRIYAVSEQTKLEIQECCGVPGDLIEVNYMGADLRLFTPDRLATRSATRAGLGFADADILLGIVGSLHERKNLVQTLDVLGELARSNPRISILFAGTGPQEEELRAQARQLGIADRVLFLGYQSDVVELMAALDVLVLFSRREGAVPRVLLEAMAMRTPVVAADLGGISEVVEDGGNGHLLEAGNAEQLEAALADILAHPERRLEMGLRARAVAEKFDRARQLGLFADSVASLVKRQA